MYLYRAISQYGWVINVIISQRRDLVAPPVGSSRDVLKLRFTVR